MQPKSKINLAIWIASTCISVLLTGPASSDVIMDWNAKAEAIGVEKQLVNVRMHVVKQCSTLPCSRR
jgi:hypothetical protein